MSAADSEFQQLAELRRWRQQTVELQDLLADQRKRAERAEAALMAAGARIETVLRGAGLTDRPDLYDSNVHSWRCGHPAAYGHCTCFQDLVADLLASVTFTQPAHE